MLNDQIPDGEQSQYRRQQPEIQPEPDDQRGGEKARKHDSTDGARAHAKGE